jgi:hypothetical protein
MRMQVLETVLACFVLASQAFSQNAAITGGGYSSPGTLVVTPGQMLTIFVAGIGKSITERVDAGALPLPTTLAGISVSWSQLSQPRAPVPLLSVFPVGTCIQGGQYPPCSTLIGITLQVPYELFVYDGGLGTIAWANFIVSDGSATGEIDFYGIEPYPHVVHFGDTIVSQPRSDADAVVTHGDGTLVTYAAPGRVGEDLTLYATGLGRTTPFVRAGDPAPVPAATTFAKFELAFDYGLNPSLVVALPPHFPAYPVRSPQTISMGPTQTSDLLAGWLVPGLAGIYQINFQVPVPPPGLQNCSGTNRPSNLTISFAGTSEFAAICVDTATANAIRPLTAGSVPIHVPRAFANFPRSTEMQRRP